MIDRHWHVGNALAQRLGELASRVENWAESNTPLTVQTVTAFRDELEHFLDEVDAALKMEANQ